jgi:NAD(P)-dependent dehydrogenase (short-subunit alcohol dehydrogenase family)
VNNAGVLIPGPLLKQSLEDVRTTFDTNVFGALHVAQTFARYWPATTAGRW